MKRRAGRVAAVAAALCGGVLVSPAHALQMSRELTITAPPAPPPLPGTPVAPIRPPALTTPQGSLFLRADRIEGDANARVVSAFGKVELRSPGETVLADELTYHTDDSRIDARGDVLLRRGFDWITGPALTFNRDSQTGAFTSPRFFIAQANARGEAGEIRFVGPQKYEATRAEYTTCVAPHPDWYLRTEELEVDNSRKVGTAHRASVYFKDVPIVYTPWLEFPLSNERKSGFLFPLFGSSGLRGFEVTTPYYLNLAPNYDATLLPRFMTKRGVQLGAQFRYLLGDGQPPFGVASGEVDAEILPHDRVTNEQRYLLAARHQEQFTPWLAGYWDLNKVSDDTYFADLADRVAITSQKTLPREVGLIAGFGNVSLSARFQSFQTLQDPSAPVAPPYNRVPQILATLNNTDWLGLTFNGFTEFARFAQGQLPPNGERLVVYPNVAFRREGPAWFFTAKAGVHARQYSLDQPTDAFPDTHPSVTVPITSVDAGLVFERPLTIANTQLIQTLEPRAFYVYIPYRNQANTPIFDTALDDFNFSQLFIENRYLGNDRVGDANELTLAVTSRFLDQTTGAERLRLALGQRFYFADQRVTLDEAPRAAGRSDFLAGAEGRLNDAWALSSLLQYNFDSSQIERFNAGVRYTPAPGSVLSATWRFTREFVDTSGIEQIKQIDLAGQWPVNDRWTLLGRWNYSVPARKTLEAVAGIEYNADCWVLRVVGQRLTTTTQQTSTSVFVQLELNGLARVGTSPLELLRRSVPGYLPSNDASLRDRDRNVGPLPEF
ncbi:MAG TPA: LPS-assembly protein LptD [Casimicrobiaceae bacterium]|nr:LPS-assembly protein LptD [Casimicrobiaceae bacterium]